MGHKRKQRSIIINWLCKVSKDRVLKIAFRWSYSWTFARSWVWSEDYIAPPSPGSFADTGHTGSDGGVIAEG